MAERLAYAKINLTLEVGDKCDDGYHLINSVMARITLADRVTVNKNESGKITFTATDKSIPTDENLCTKAARLCLEALKKAGQGVDITLENRIPTASGMGGGSADAAAVIECIEEIFGTLDSTARHRIALSIGADVPYCLEKTPCFCTGIGDICKPLRCSTLEGLWLTVSKVGEKLSTGKVYSDLDAITNRESHNDHSLTVEALEKGDIYQLSKSTFNDFEQVVFPSSPEVEREYKRLLSMGAIKVTMSGAGPTLIAFFDDEEKAKMCGTVYKIIT